MAPATPTADPPQIARPPRAGSVRCPGNAGCLWQHAPPSVRELSRLLQLDPGTLSPLFKRLEANGYVRRERDAADERSLAVTLTASGQALRIRAEQIPPAIVARLGLPMAELEQLHTALTRVIATAHGTGPAPERPGG